MTCITSMPVFGFATMSDKKRPVLSQMEILICETKCLMSFSRVMFVSQNRRIRCMPALANPLSTVKNVCFYSNTCLFLQYYMLIVIHVCFYSNTCLFLQ